MHLVREKATRSKDLHGEDARLAELTRDYQINRDIYQDLLRRREQARVSVNLDNNSLGPNLKILEPAALSPSSVPRSLLFVLGGLALSILIPLGLFYTRIKFDPRIRAAGAISQKHNIPIVAIVPHVWNPGELPALRKELTVLAIVVTATLVLSATLSVVQSLGAL